MKTNIYKKHEVLKKLYEKNGSNWKKRKSCLAAFDGTDHESRFLTSLCYTFREHEVFMRPPEMLPSDRVNFLLKSNWTEELDPDAYGGQKNALYYKVSMSGLSFLTKFMNVKARDEDVGSLAIYMLKQNIKSQ